MSYGPPVNTPKVSSQDQYRYNKEQVEMAKRALEQFESMNENAWRQHREEELARKISEGERAREELEKLRAPLAIAAPPMISEPQVPYSPHSLYIPTTARIEEVPSNTAYGDQRVVMQNPYASTSNNQVQMNRPVQNSYTSTSSSRVQVNQPTQSPYPTTPSFRVQMNQPVQNPYSSMLSSQFQMQPAQNHQSFSPTPHTFFNNSGTIQEQPDRAATGFRHTWKATPSQATRTPASVHQPMNPAIVRSQVSQSAPPQQIVIPAAQNNPHWPAPPARKQSGPQQPLESARSNTQQKAIVIQQQNVSREGHSLRTIAPKASVSVKSSEHGHSKSPANPYTSLIVVGQGAPVRTNIAMQDNAHANTSASTVGQPKETTLPTTQSSPSTSSDVNARLFQQVSSYQPFIDYLRAGYPQWVDSIRPDTYSTIPNTPLSVAKRSDDVMFLVVPDGQGGYAFLNLVDLIKTAPVTAQPASLGNVRQSAGLPNLPRSTTLIGNIQMSVQPPGVSQSQLHTASGAPSTALEGSSQSSVQATIIPQSQLPITKPHSTASEIGGTQTSVQSQAVPQSPLRTGSEPQQNQEKSPIASPRKPNLRTPADADKRHLARDILRALGFKRPRPMNLSETHLEPAFKRHRPGSGFRVASRRWETHPTQATPRAVPVDEMQGVQSGQPVVSVQPIASGEQSTQENVEPVGTSVVDTGPTLPVSDTVPAVNIPESAQPGLPVASVVPSDELKSAPIPTDPHAGSSPIDASVVLATDDEPVTAPSTLIDVPSPIIKSPKLGPVIENVAPESAIECSPEEPTIMDVDGSLPSTHAEPYIVESPVTKALDFQKSDDAASEFDRLTIQDETISLAMDHPESSLQIEELEDEVEILEARDASREGLMLPDVREPEEDGEMSALGYAREVSQEAEITILEDLRETSREEEEATMALDLRQTSQEEGEITMVRDLSETSPEEAEITILQDLRKTSPEEGEILMSPEIKRGLGDAEGMPPVQLVTPMPQAKEEQKKPSTPLFLPSPSSSVQSPSSSSMIPPLYMDEDMPGVDGISEATKAERKLKSIYRRVRTGDQPFYVLVPSSPPYLVKFRKEEARRQRKKRKLASLQSDAVDYRRHRYDRSASQEDVVDPATKKTLEDSTTRLAERRCKWSGCDTVMNSPQHLFKHLRRHCVPDYTKKYVLCYWTGCGDHIPNAQIDEHLATHAFTPLSCPYEDCEESFRAVQSLVKHNDSNHKNGRLKRSPEPFAPSIKEPPPPAPSQVPAYMINSGLVRQEPIDRRRHLSLLGPWVYNNIAGPVKVTKKYNAAKGKPDDYEPLQDSSMHFSTILSQPTKIRDMGDLQSVEVSELVSDGLIIWPSKKMKGSQRMDAELKPLVPNTSSEEDELQDDDLFGNGLVPMDEPEVGQARNLEVKHVPHPTGPTQTSSDEDAVATMLTES